MDSKSQQAGNKVASGLRIEDLRTDVVELSPEDFEDRYGSAFLLLSSTGFKQSKSATSTEVLLLDPGEVAGDRTAGVSVQVIPIRAAENSHTHLITVGRTSQNDVSMADISVSRLHAYFKRTKEGAFQLHDAGSTNGTIVNDVSVCTKETGPPTDVKSGDSIRFGQIDVTFLEVEALRSYVVKFGD
ncbi:MAG: FHA domain-containing protein [Deltaproteobacteria bacterium]|nr:FHA domain-containing protein [Deltaproteobacteria bacterium]